MSADGDKSSTPPASEGDENDRHIGESSAEAAVLEDEKQAVEEGQPSQGGDADSTAKPSQGGDADSTAKPSAKRESSSSPVDSEEEEGVRQRGVKRRKKDDSLGAGGLFDEEEIPPVANKAKRTKKEKKKSTTSKAVKSSKASKNKRFLDVAESTGDEGSDTGAELQMQSPSQRSPGQIFNDKLANEVKRLEALIAATGKVQSQRIIQPGETCGPDPLTPPADMIRKAARYMAMNAAGWIVSHEDAASSFVEVFRVEASQGQRTFRTANPLNYTTGAIGRQGFALLRPGTLAANGEWKPSILEYHLFESWDDKGKSWWTKQLPSQESFLTATVGEDFVASVTSERNLRVFSCTGLQKSLFVVDGIPVCLVAWNSLLMVVTAEACLASLADQKYKVLLYDVHRNLELLSAPLAVPARWGSLTWAAVSELAVPTLCFATGKVLGLLPILHSPSLHISATHFVPNQFQPPHCRWSPPGGPDLPVGSWLPFGQRLPQDASSKWVPLIDLKEAVERMPRETRLVPIQACAGHIEVFCMAEGNRQIPVVSDPRALPRVFKLPYRTPLAAAPTNPRNLLSYSKWISRIKADKHLKDQMGVTPLPWQYLDSVRLLQTFFWEQLEFCRLYEIPLPSLLDVPQPATASTSYGPTSSSSSSSSSESSMDISAEYPGLPIGDEGIEGGTAANGVGAEVLFAGVPLPEDPNEKREELMYRLRASTDTQTFKIHLKALTEARMELTLDCIRQFKLPRTLRHSHLNLQKSNCGPLMERFNSLVEEQLSLDKELIQSGVNVDENLRELSLFTAFAEDTPPPLAINAIVRRYGRQDDDQQLLLETPASVAATKHRQQLLGGAGDAPIASAPPPQENQIPPRCVHGGSPERRVLSATPEAARKASNTGTASTSNIANQRKGVMRRAFDGMSY